MRYFLMTIGFLGLVDMEWYNMRCVSWGLVGALVFLVQVRQG